MSFRKYLYILGDGFTSVHKDINPNLFIQWVKKENIGWSREHRDVLNRIIDKGLEDLLNEISRIKDECLSMYFSQWYRETYYSFVFSSQQLYSYYVTSYINKLILSIIYSIPENVIQQLTEEKSNIEPKDFICIWLIGLDSSSELFKKVLDVFQPNNTDININFKLIHSDEEQLKSSADLMHEKGFTNCQTMPYQSLMSRPNDDEIRGRIKRYERFQEFAKTAKGTFENLAANTSSAERFQWYYMLNTITDDNNKKRQVTVFWGSRPIRTYNNGRGFNSEIECGAQLNFYQDETGYVSVSLYPAKTDNRHPIEDCIVVYNTLEPKKLLNQRMQQLLWSYLLAYMESTSLDGKPSKWQKLQVRWMRTTKHMIINSTYQDRRIKTDICKLVRYVMTVALSGILVFVCQILYNHFNPDTSVQDSSNRLIQVIDQNNVQLQQSIDVIDKSIATRDSAIINAIHDTVEIK